MIEIRPGGPDDIPSVMALLDQAGAWLVEQGRPGQWGTSPQSDSPRRQQQSKLWVETPGALHLAIMDGEPVGALVVGVPLDYIAPATEPELYVNLLVTDRRRKGSGIGTVLLDHARDLARQRGVSLLRVDCYAGDDSKLVAYYVGQGFTPTESFTFDSPTLGLWRGQIFEQRLS